MKKLLLSFPILCAISLQAQFGATLEICTTDPTMKSLHQIDFDGDGDMDLLATDGETFDEYGMTPIAAAMSAQTFALCENTGGGNFVNHDLFQLSVASLWTFGDLTGDGLADFIYGEFPIWNSGNDSYTVYYRENLGGYTFGPDQVVYDLIAYDEEWVWYLYYSRLCIGDLDNDGSNELAIMMNGIPGEEDTYSEPENVYVIDFNSGVFSSPEYLFYASTAWGSNYGFAGVLYDLRIYDLDSDGQNDIVYFRACGDGSELNVHYGTGSGQFEPDPINLVYSQNYDLIDSNQDGNYGFIGFDPVFYSELQVYEDAYYLDAIFEPLPTHAAGVAAIDVSGDSDFDVVSCTQAGEIVLFVNDGTWPDSNGTLSEMEYTLFDAGITETVSAIYHMDFNGIGGDDVLLMAEGHVYVVLNDMIVDELATIQVTPFLDENGNQILDSSENEISDYMFSLTPSGGVPSYYYGFSGTQTIDVIPGNYELSLIDNYGALSLADATPINISLTDITDSLVVEIPLEVDGTPITEMQLFSYGLPGVCNGPSTNHYLYVFNTGSLPANGTVTYELDDVHSFISSQPTETNVSGNIITWDITDLAPGNHLIIVLDITSALTTDLGANCENTMTLEVLDNMGNIELTIVDETNYTVTCAYDPNDITEHNGYTDQGFILDGDELEYTIRFQNTGNAPATNVRIENQLSDLLIQNTLQPIAWSHDFDLVIDETGKAIFTFPNINLPDSVNNEPESHGFVTYRIHPLSGLLPMTVIENTAEIYFDFNPAVVTNTEINTIYDCDDLSQTTISSTEACVGEIIAASNNGLWVETVSWDYNEQIQSGVSIDLPLQETAVLSMTASNSLCTFEQQWALNVISTEANFTVNGSVLTANDGETFQWYLNGMPIENASQQTYEISQTGSYQVMVTNAQGCAEISESTQVTYTGIPVFSLSESYLYPNPMRDQATLKLPEGTWVVSVTDSHGKVLKRHQNCSGNFVLRREGLANGTYRVEINNGLISEIYRLILN